MAGKRIVPACILLVVSALLLLFLAPGTGVEAHNWVTKYNLWLDGAKTSAPGAAATSLTAYDIAATAGGTNFDTIISATGYPEANIAMDSAIVDGSSIGDIVSNTTLALMNSACATPIQVVIPFMDCTTDTLKTAPWVGSGDNLVQDNDGDMNEDGSSAAPGTGNCIDGIENDGVPDGIDNADPHCINEATDNNGLPTYCDHYPAYLNDMYNDIRPRARYEGHTVVLKDAPASQLNFVIFNPEALSALPTVAGTLGDTYGYLDFVVLDNPTQPVSPSTVTDFCSPLSSFPTLLGTTDGSYTVMPGPEPYEPDSLCNNGADNDGDGWKDDGCLVFNAGVGAGQQRSENPAPLTGLFGTGTHVVRTYSMSQRDADGDTIANNFDTCPYDPNIGDSDGDRIDDACDPFKNTKSAVAPATCAGTAGLYDEDQDCFPNLQDNCPLVPNGWPYDQVNSAPGVDQSDTDNPPGNPEPTDNGPGKDAIGDACDKNPNKADGHFHVASPIDAVCIPDPLGADDSDGDGDSDDDDDGWCDITEVLLGSDPANANSTPEHISLDLAIGSGATTAPGTCSDFTVYDHPDSGPIDNDLDGKANALDPDCASPGDSDKDGVPDDLDNCPNEKNPEQVDSDGDGAGDECDTDDDNDGMSDANENYMGTDPKDASADDPDDPVDPNDGWDPANPWDFNSDMVVDVTDYVKFTAHYPAPTLGKPYDRRYNFNAHQDVVVDVTDYVLFVGKYPSDTLRTFKLCNHTGQAVDDIYIYWKWWALWADVWDMEGAGGTRVNWNKTLFGSYLTADRPDAQGDLADGKCVNVRLNATRVPQIRCYDWTLDGVVINGSPWPCSFRNDTGQAVNDIHYESHYSAYCAATFGPAGAWRVVPTSFPPKKSWDVTFPSSVAVNQTVTRHPQIPSRTWMMNCWWWTDEGAQVGPIHGTCLYDATLSEDGCGANTCGDNIDNGPLCNGAGKDGKDAADTDDCYGPAP